MVLDLFRCKTIYNRIKSNEGDNMGAIVGMYLAVVRIRVFGLNSRTGDRIHATHIFNGFVQGGFSL